jgi:hypothetical protein
VRVVSRESMRWAKQILKKNLWLKITIEALLASYGDVSTHIQALSNHQFFRTIVHGKLKIVSTYIATLLTHVQDIRQIFFGKITTG